MVVSRRAHAAAGTRQRPTMAAAGTRQRPTMAAAGTRQRPTMAATVRTAEGCFLFLLFLQLATPAAGISAPNTSLATIPVGYFGGHHTAPTATRGTVPCSPTAGCRPTDNFAMLAKMRLVMVEKWEGHCTHYVHQSTCTSLATVWPHVSLCVRARERACELRGK